MFSSYWLWHEWLQPLGMLGWKQELSTPDGSPRWAAAARALGLHHQPSLAFWQGAGLWQSSWDSSQSSDKGCGYHKWVSLRFVKQHLNCVPPQLPQWVHYDSCTYPKELLCALNEITHKRPLLPLGFFAAFSTSPTTVLIPDLQRQCQMEKGRSEAWDCSSMIWPEESCFAPHDHLAHQCFSFLVEWKC